MKRGKKLIWAMLFLPFCFVYSQLLETPYQYGSKEEFEANEYFDKLNIRLAEERLISMLEKYSDSPAADKAEILSANVEFLTGNYKNADSKLNDFINQRSNSPIRAHAAILRAYIFFEQKKYNKAVELFTKSKELSESEFLIRKDSVYRILANNSLYWGAISYCHLGKYQEAKPLFEECFRVYPDQKYADDALFSLGIIEEINLNYSVAISYYNTISKKYPFSNSYIASRVREINNKLMLRDPIQALDILGHAQNVLVRIAMKDSVGKLYEIQTFSNNAGPDLQFLQGEAQNIAGNYEQALIEYRTYIETYSNPELDDYVRLGAAWSLLNLSKYKEAIDFYDTVLENTNEENQRAKAIAKLYKAVALKRIGNREQANKEFSALSIQAGYPYIGQVLLELGQMYYEEGNFDEAKRALERAEREATEGAVKARIQLLSGATNMELRNFDKAAMDYAAAEQVALRTSAQFMPQKDWYITESRLKRGMALVMAHRNSEAITVLNSYIGDDKKDNRKDEALFWLAEAYYRSDLLKNSAETYSQILTQYPASQRKEEAIYGQGWSFFRLKNFKRSSEIFDKMARYYPNSKYTLEVLARQADGYYITKDYKNAAEAYKKAADLAPRTEEGQYCAYQLCHALYRLGAYEKAITYLLSFVRFYPNSNLSPYALYLIGWIRFQQKEYKEAIGNFEHLTQAYNQHDLIVRAYYAIGDSYYNMSDFEKAIGAYNVIVNQFPSHELASEAWKSLQFCYIALGREDEAIRIADSVISSHPNTPFAQELFIKKADMFYSGAKFNDAVSEYQNFMKSYPDSKRNSEALYWMGKSYINMNEYDKATDAFVELEKKYFDSDFTPLAMLENALLKKKIGDLNYADSIFQKIEEKFPDNENSAQAGFERAVIKYNMGDTINAIKLYVAVADKYTGLEFGDQSRYRVAGYYMMNELNDSARYHYDLIANSKSDPVLSAEAQYRIGELWMRDKNLEKAASAYLVIRDFFPGVEKWYPLGMINLGEIYELLNQNDKAIDVYKAVLNQYPENDYGNTVKLRLKRLGH